MEIFQGEKPPKPDDVYIYIDGSMWWTLSKNMLTHPNIQHGPPPPPKKIAVHWVGVSPFPFCEGIFSCQFSGVYLSPTKEIRPEKWRFFMTNFDVPWRKLVYKWLVNGLFHLLINGVYWGYNPVILTVDPIFLEHPRREHGGLNDLQAFFESRKVGFWIAKPIGFMGTVMTS